MKKTYQWTPKTTVLIVVLIIVKSLVFYAYTAELARASLLLGTLSWLAFLLLLFWVVFRGKFFLLYCVISCILFVDFLYFQYFGFLPSVKELVHVGQVGAVKDSIIYVLHPESFIFIVDLIPVGFYLRKKAPPAEEWTVRKPGYTDILITIVMLISLIVPFSSEALQSYFVFNRYGVLAYHMFDLVKAVPGVDKGIAVDERVSYNGYVNKMAEAGKYFSIAEGRNIIVIQLESFQDFLVNFSYNGQEITPNLNRLISADSLYFDEVYQQVGAGNTSDCEFVILNSMHSLGEVSVYQTRENNDFYSLPSLLRSEGYYTVAFHGNNGWFWNREKIYPALGFSDFISLEDMESDEIIGFGLSDFSLFRQTLEHLESLVEPFFAFIVTLTSHNPYEIPEELRSIELLPEHEETLFGNYIQSVNYADRALGEFVEGLEKSGLYEDSLIVLYGDHAGLYPFNKENKDILTDLLQDEYDFAQAMNIPLIFHIPGSDLRIVNSTVGGQIDFFPTLLNLIGIVERNGILFGRDLLNASSGFAALTHYVPEGSFIDNSRVFIMSSDGVLNNSSAIDRNSGVEIAPFSCLDGYKDSIQQIAASKYFILNNSISNLTGGTGAEEN
ncbi:LTA synthase family protein [Mesotoga sp.]|uniref:LTA synthase family protein n=1 Tax=Mesotoga sp. TaxID=2053577 RepID=UPI00345E43F8